jgi:hypothetical protein
VISLSLHDHTLQKFRQVRAILAQWPPRGVPGLESKDPLQC